LAGVKSSILPALLNFCDTNKEPMHFVSWHIYSSSPRAVRDTIADFQSIVFGMGIDGRHQAFTGLSHNCNLYNFAGFGSMAPCRALCKLLLSPAPPS
jgi:hypothetical protein